VAPVPPVIVVPGITASSLRDEYSLPPETVWSVLNKDYARISLHPDDTRYEVMEPARMRADQLLEVAYRELIEELRYNLRPSEDEPVPVYPFSYDWRHPLDALEVQLDAFVDEVIERTKLMRHYHVAGYGNDPKVVLVGHSMGGLIITGYLSQRRRGSRVAKVVTLATPFRGSFEAAIKLTTGTANLGAETSSSREREAARVTPALYHLLPTCPGLEVEKGLAGTCLFDASLWQGSILETLEEYVRLYAVSRKDRPQQARELFHALLAAARAHRERIESFRLSHAGLKPADWLCVVGVDAKTRVRLKVKRLRQGPQFEFDGEDRENRWLDGIDDAAKRATGDGTVPFEGALPRFLALENLVCVTPDDYGYWEIQDRALTKVAGFHGILPNMNMLHRLIVRHLTGRPDTRGNTWARPAPGVAKWQPPLSLTLKQ
jgi:pimeloyl-ACP methyl ester carboxylesterase